MGVSSGRIHVEMESGLEVALPVRGNARLEGRSENELENIEVSPFELHWPDLDEDLSIGGILAGDSSSQPARKECGMAFELKGPSRSVTIDTSDEVILFTLPQQLDLTTPICDRLWTSFYADPELRSVEEVAQFRVEIASIRSGYADWRAACLIRERRIRARRADVVERIVAQLLAGDRVLSKCDELLELCDEAIQAGAGLVGISD
jgi:hypothetical protein